MSFQSLYVGTTGMVSHGTRMQNIGNNIANVSTVGYKSTNTHFQTLISDSLASGNSGATSGPSQVGLGVGLGAILTDFRTGAMIGGSDITDLGISGKGFFRVVGPDNNLTNYTRAGNFRFDNSGFLVDPSGSRLQGQEITDGVNGATTDIQLRGDANGQFSVAPSATTEVSFISNIGLEHSKASSTANPMFSMFENWNGAATPPLGSGLYGFQSAIKVYDESGTQQTLNVYFDKADVSNAGSRDYFEFMVTMNPANDARAGITGTSGAGVLMTGVMTFDSTGQMVDLAAFSYGGAGDTKVLSNWTPTSFTANGYPQLSASFADSGDSSTIGINFGLSASAYSAGGASNAGAVGTVAGNLPSMASATRNALTTTAFLGTSAVSFQSQDGYAEGFLVNLDVDKDGILLGKYSNGIQQELYQITLYNFPGEFGLRREGGNHFSETMGSGAAVEGFAGQDNFGGINSNSLEQSNVDIAEQFVKMIITERGFQANSKIITTADEIIKNAIQMKR
ncbi:MAG: flagellar hook-basal body complex protein [Proteobacteria bacterium]|nr:flagellar hook-basal body complex protein [Pseudomonadota bacterium]